jgi:hypothetical protein
MQRRLMVVSAIAVIGAALFLPGSGLGSSAAFARGAHEIPAGLAAAIHERLGRASIRSADPAPEHPELGVDVALSADGTTALVGAPGVGNGKGAVYVYHVASAGSWGSSSTPVATLSQPLGHRLQSLGGWGIALSADGATAFVGTPNDRAVYVFHASSEDAWASSSTPTAKLTTTYSDVFGWSLAASSDGTTLVVGDPTYGRASVFHVSSADVWASTSTPTATLSDAAAGSFFSWAVAISGDGTTVLTSDPRVVGGAAVYHVPAASAWTSSSTPTAILTNASDGDHEFLGGAVALSGDGTTAFLGDSAVNGYTGAVDVFHVAGEALWLSSSTPAAILTNGAGATEDYLGDLLAASTDGKTVVAEASGAHQARGAAYVFRASGEDAWASTSTPTAELSDSARAHDDVPVTQYVRGDSNIGDPVAIAADGATILLGAPWFNWRSGRADVFHVADAGAWLTSSTPTAALTNSALPKPRCVVPRLAGYYVPFAKEELDDANCRLGNVKRVHSAKRNKRKIVSQSPAAWRNLPPGSKVNVKVGK